MASAWRGGRRLAPHRPVRPVYVRPHGGVPHLSTTTSIPLQWSFTIVTTVSVSTVTTDDEDAWTVPLEWSFVMDVDPVDDVED